MEEFGLNLNDYWTLRSGTIAEALPSSSSSKMEAAERMQRKAAAEARDQKRLNAEQRLRAAVQTPGGGGRLGDTRMPGKRPSEANAVRAAGSNARAAAHLCMALAEARRVGVRSPQLLQQAEALHALLEHAAAEDYARAHRQHEDLGRDQQEVRKEVLVHQLSVHSWRPFEPY